MSGVISIVIPAFNQLAYCRQCITSVQANTQRPYQLILVDNGSTDGVGEYFDSVPGACVVHAGFNRGFAAGVNLGLTHAKGHVVLLNSDTLVPTGWLARLENALLQSADIGMVGPRTNYASGSQQIDGLQFTSIEEISQFAAELAERNQGKLTDTNRLVGFCLVIRDVVLDEVGRFDESFGLGNFEDDDYCLRVRQAGYRLCVAEDAFVFHYGSRTFLGMGFTDDNWKALMNKNAERFAKKWRVPLETRQDAAQQSRRLNQQAQEAFQKGHITDAIRLLKDAVERFPLWEQNYNDLGVVLWQINERDRAFEQFVRAVRLQPWYAEARDNLLEVAKATGRSDEAAALLREAERTAPLGDRDSRIPT